MRLFIDSDILLDAVLFREPHHDFALRILSFADKQDHLLCISAHSLLNVYYFTRKMAGKPAATKSVNLLTDKLVVLPTDSTVIRAALNLTFTDIEDAVQYSVALTNDCNTIITRTLKDYKKSQLPVMTAEQYLKTHS